MKKKNTTPAPAIPGRSLRGSHSSNPHRAQRRQKYRSPVFRYRIYRRTAGVGGARAAQPPLQRPAEALGPAAPAGTPGALLLCTTESTAACTDPLKKKIEERAFRDEPGKQV